MRKSIVTSLAVLLLAIPASAAKETPPKPQPLAEASYPDFVEKTLANGLRVVVIEHHEQPAVSLRLEMKAGRLYEPAEAPGLAQATAALLTQGTESRSAQEIAQEIDFVGGNLNAGAGWDQTFASARVTSDQLELGLSLLADVVLHASFPEEEVERWRKQTLSGLQVNFTDPSFLADAAFDRLVFGGHPYGQPGSGTPDTVRAMAREDMAAFHSRCYLPGGSILAVVGDVAPEKAFAEVEKAFGGWAKGEAPAAPPAATSERETPRILVIDKPDAVQTQIRVGHLGLAYTDDDYFNAQVYNSVVGGGVSARLYEEIRRKRGLSYGAGSSFAEQSQPGWFRANTFTKTESTVETLGLVMEVLGSMEGDLVPEDELEDRKTYITGSLPMLIETPDGLATRVLEAMRYGYGKQFLDGYMGRIAAVSPEQVKDFAVRRIHPDRAAIVLAGNAAGFAEALEAEFGAFETVAMSDLDLTSPDLRRAERAVEAVSAEQKAAAGELLKQMIEAHGGEAFLQQRSQISRGTGTVQMPGAPQPMALETYLRYQAFPDRFRAEIKLAFGPMLQVFDGESGWVTMMGQTRDQSAQFKEQLHYGVDALRYLDSGYELRPSPDEELDGRPVKVVEAEGPEGRVNRYFVDAETHLVAKVAYEVEARQIEQVVGDYKVIEGIPVAHHTAISVNGAPYLDLQLSEVEINSEIDEALFAKPEGAP